MKETPERAYWEQNTILNMFDSVCVCLLGNVVCSEGRSAVKGKQG